MVAIDARTESDGSMQVYTHGGRRPTGIDAVAWARQVVERGAGEIMLTSMNTDGHQDGYDIPLTRAVSDAVGVPVIASGGAGNAQHMIDAIAEGRADAVLAASIFHFGTHPIMDVKRQMQAAGIAIRMEHADYDDVL